MKFGAKMTENVKELILKYSMWEDEKAQLDEEFDNEERKKFLFDFRKKVYDYKLGVKVEIPWITEREVIEGKRSEKSNTSIYRKPINFQIIH